MQWHPIKIACSAPAVTLAGGELGSGRRDDWFLVRPTFSNKLELRRRLLSSAGRARRCGESSGSAARARARTYPAQGEDKMIAELEKIVAYLYFARWARFQLPYPPPLPAPTFTSRLLGWHRVATVLYNKPPEPRHIIYKLSLYISHKPPLDKRNSRTDRHDKDTKTSIANFVSLRNAQEGYRNDTTFLHYFPQSILCFFLSSFSSSFSYSYIFFLIFLFSCRLFSVLIPSPIS